jgi:hypothetical protein
MTHVVECFPANLKRLHIHDMTGMSALGQKQTFAASAQCPLSGLKRTWIEYDWMSANDPKRTSPVPFKIPI